MAKAAGPSVRTGLLFYLSRIPMNYIYCWSKKNKPERLERTQTGMIIPVYIGANQKEC